jgi:hypothetical protein
MPALDYGYSKVSSKHRGRTPPPRSAPSNFKSRSAQGPRPETSYDNADEWLQHVSNRGALVEELYKRPNWKSFIGAHSTPELRKKLLQLSPHDLAEILVKLDSR